MVPMAGDGRRRPEDGKDAGSRTRQAGDGRLDGWTLKPGTEDGRWTAGRRRPKPKPRRRTSKKSALRRKAEKQKIPDTYRVFWHVKTFGPPRRKLLPKFFSIPLPSRNAQSAGIRARSTRNPLKVRYCVPFALGYSGLARRG